ncbi:hypothetical protein LSAT2_008377 [Lamellibrachia satsuma]|nr:hypothetical protein LSAT2_008377 [Lamellibrachia satsuma]
MHALHLRAVFEVVRNSSNEARPCQEVLVSSACFSTQRLTQAYSLVVWEIVESLTPLPASPWHPRLCALHRPGIPGCVHFIALASPAVCTSSPWHLLLCARHLPRTSELAVFLV